MNGEWCYYKQMFSKEFCENLIKEVHTLPSRQATLGVDGTIPNNSVRKSIIRFIQRGDARFNELFDKLWRAAFDANNDFFNFHISKLDFIQVAEYDESYAGEYKEHHDVFWLNDDPFFHRKLSCIVQLSDHTTYEGGDFVITEAVHPFPEDIKLQGNVIFFPSMLRHKATPVTKGKRYSLAAWFDGPKWR